MSLTTVTIQERRFHPIYLTVKIPDLPNLRIKTVSVPLLVAEPPSPWFAGQNMDINLEPFPDFTDICTPVKAEALHCVLHCHNDICWRLARYQFDVPPCRCGDEVFQDEPAVCTPPVRGLEITLENMFELALQEDWSPTSEINIQRDDAVELMSKFTFLVVRRVRGDANFMNLLRERWADPEDAAGLIVLTLFQLIEKYFENTMRDIEVRTITPQTLRAELKFFLSTGLEDWMDDYCAGWECELVEQVTGGDPRYVLEGANFGLLDVISELWIDCRNDIVLLFVLRDARVRQYVAEQPL